MIEVKDEILQGEPTYDIVDGSGNVVLEDVKIEMKTPVVQEGTPINKALFDTIQDDFDSTYRNIPKGLICMWSGSEVPNGWYLCNGENGTPDLRNRFVVGSGSDYSIGDKGGSNTVALTVANLPEHEHYTKVRESSSDRATEGNGDVLSGNWSGQTELVMHKGSGYDFTINTSNTGSGTAHENRPPYYALAYIMKG